MKTKNIRQIPNTPGGNGPSRFIVDLRPPAPADIAPPVKKEKRSEKKKSLFRLSWPRMAKTARRGRKLKPNLLYRRRPESRFSKNLGRLASRALIALGLRRRPVWQRFLEEQARIMSRPFRRKGGRAAIAAGRRDIFGPIRRQPLLSFALILILIILPFKILSAWQIFDIDAWKSRVMDRSRLAISDLMAAAESTSRRDFQQADNSFRSASQNFLAATDDLSQMNDAILALAALSNDPRIKVAAESKKFLMSGALAASLGRDVVAATDALFGDNHGDWPAALDKFLDAGRAAVSDAQALKKNLGKIKADNLPEEYRARFAALNSQAALLSDNLASFVAAAERFQEILGLSRDKRYLVVFQNNAELRASGGFIGSFALLDLHNGAIRNLEVPGGGSYDTEGGLRVRVAAPQPLWLVSPLWHFWDANWWPDWTMTARNLMWFYQKSDGPSVDGVIGVTPTVMEKLLEVTGPIDLTKEYGLTITAENFWETVELITEQKNLQMSHPDLTAPLVATSAPLQTALPLEQGLEKNPDNKPKKIIGDLLAKILEILPNKLDQDNLVRIITLFGDSLDEKQILFYFTDPSLQKEISDRNWGGEIRATDRDYLLVVDTNIAGQKTDRLIDEHIDQQSEVGADGRITNTVRITRTHEGQPNAPLVGVRNVDWLRVYVPAGSELLSADGFLAPEQKYFKARPDGELAELPDLAAEKAAATAEPSGTKIYGEKGKTVFANWVMVDPGQTATITLRYQLPFNFWDPPQNNENWLKRLSRWLSPGQPELLPYSLLVQKQPGARPANFSSRLILPPGALIFWRYPDDLAGDDGWRADDILDSDKYWSALIQKNNK